MGAWMDGTFNDDELEREYQLFKTTGMRSVLLIAALIATGLTVLIATIDASDLDIDGTLWPTLYIMRNSCAEEGRIETHDPSSFNATRQEALMVHAPLTIVAQGRC